MKQEITNEFASKILKLSSNYKAEYSIEYKNIEVQNRDTKEVRFISIHEFIHTHCMDYLISYANGLKIIAETKHSDIDRRIIILSFEIYLTVPNLVDGDSSSHTEIFSGLSELKVYVDAVEWLMKYRKDNLNLSKFWINKF